MILLNGIGKAAIYNGIEKDSLRVFLKKFLTESQGNAGL
jgi:hypothetical protein